MAHNVEPMSEATFRRLMASKEGPRTELIRLGREADAWGRLAGLELVRLLERQRREAGGVNTPAEEGTDR